MLQDTINTVVRFHDVRRLSELTRCIFSLVGQSYRPLRIILLTQRFSADDIATTERALAPFLEGETGVELAVKNWANAEPVDARSVLLNLGVQEANGRYIAFLDYDDVLYPDAYALFVDKLRETSAAIAFASVRVIRLHPFKHFFYAERQLPPFRGSTLLDLFRQNYCPLHSYVIDLQQVDRELMTYKAGLLMEEDYDVLLRICARYKSDFSLIGTNIGDYYYKTDGSNTVPTDGAGPAESDWRFKGVRTSIEHRKCTTMLAEEVQRTLGLPAHQRLSIRNVLDHYA